MARLIINPCTPQARHILLKPGVNRLGRNEGNDFTIDDASVSGSHCELIVSEAGARLRDVGSTNGTFVNGTPVTEADLQTGQLIQLGGVQLVFETDGAPVAVASEAAGHAPKPGPLRISLATVKEAPVAVAAAEPPVGEEPPPATVALPPNAPCKYHPRTPARWVCTSCHKAYCDLCVSARSTATGSQMFCRSCGGVAAPVHVTVEAPKQRSFFRELPRAVIYPFRGTGLMILIVATLLFAALEFMSAGIFGLLIQIMAIGYLFSYVQNIIHSTAAEDDELPQLPGFDDVWSGFFRLMGCVLMSFGPALIVAYFAIAQQQPAAGVALIPAVIFGCLYFPMAFLAVAIKDNVMASNPLVVVPSILRVPLEYIVTVILLAGVFGVRWVGDAISSEMGYQSLRTTSMGEMFLMFGLRALWAFLSVYLLTVTMRILGLLYLTKSHRLGW